MGQGGWPDQISRGRLDNIIALADLEQVDPQATIARSLATTCRDSHCPSGTATDSAGNGFESLTLVQHQLQVSQADTAAQAGNWAACISYLCHTTGGWPDHDGEQNLTKQRLEYIRDNAPVGHLAHKRAVACLSHCPHGVAGGPTDVATHRSIVFDAWDKATKATTASQWADVANELDHVGGGG